MPLYETNITDMTMLLLLRNFSFENVNLKPKETAHFVHPLRVSLLVTPEQLWVKAEEGMVNNPLTSTDNLMILEPTTYHGFTKRSIYKRRNKFFSKERSRNTRMKYKPQVCPITEMSLRQLAELKKLK